MAKQQVVNKKVLSVTGRLFKDIDTERYKVSVETKDGIDTYDLEDDFIKEMVGEIITLSSDIVE